MLYILQTNNSDIANKMEVDEVPESVVNISDANKSNEKEVRWKFIINWDIL